MARKTKAEAELTRQKIICAARRVFYRCGVTKSTLDGIAANRGFIDDVIMPHGTRRRVCKALASLENKKLENPWRKHGNPPL